MSKWWSAVVVGVLVLAGGPAAAQSDFEGACPPDDGVTVVVDFQELGGETIVRCGQGTIENGLDVLAEARVAYDPVPADPNTICRIESLPTDRACGDDISTATARWTYWTATPGGEWEAVDGGPVDRDPPDGSVDGWSWTASGDAVPPRTAPPESGGPRPDPDPTLDEATPAESTSTTDATTSPTEPGGGSETTMDGTGRPDATDPDAAPGSVVDADDDGLPNDVDPDVDGDGTPNASDPDVDGDGTPNEDDPDVDGDGTPNDADPDPDGTAAPPLEPEGGGTPWTAVVVVGIAAAAVAIAAVLIRRRRRST